MRSSRGSLEPAAWPALVDEAVHRATGEPRAAERLGGMSGADVWRVRGPAGSVVLKRATRSEAAFYREIAPDLRAAGVSVVACRWTIDDSAASWLVLEEVPHPLPEARRLADPAVIGALRRLHALTWDRPPARTGQYVPYWTAPMTDAALAALGGERDALAPLLTRAEQRVQPLFAPRCAISGDPNPANWGLRVGGSLALFDWERYTAGTPPLDLAITLPGLGDLADFALVAERYLAGAPKALTAEWTTAGHLAREIALAKVWSVVEFLSGQHASRDGSTDDVIVWLRSEVPAWLLATMPFALYTSC